MLRIETEYSVLRVRNVQCRRPGFPGKPDRANEQGCLADVAEQTAAAGIPQQVVQNAMGLVR